MTNLLCNFSASDLNNVKVVVSDDLPADDVTEDDLNGEDFTSLGSHDGPVEEGDTIKIKPEDGVPGKVVVIFVPGEGTLSLGDVKVYVRPVTVPAPGEPEGPDGPDGPEEVTNPEQPSGGSSGENPENGNDGNPDTCFTSDKQTAPWWSVNLGKEWEIVAVHIVACSDSRKSLYYGVLNL